MKLIRIFGIVLALHVVGGILFFQPGCQSQPRPEATETAPRTGAPMERLEWEGEDESYVESDRPRSAPTRPAPGSSREVVDDSPLRPLPSGLEPIPSVGEGEQQGELYTVRSGDSLWVIANRNKVSLSALLKANDLTENSVIQPGQKLRIPAGGSSPSTSRTASTPPEGTETYTVRSGDSLSVIAQRHNTTVSRLKDLNNMSSDVIRVDQKLIVPAGGANAPARNNASRPAAAPSGDGIRHSVKAGETPGGIASQYGVTIDELMRANNISDPRRMQIGQELIIPGTGSREKAEEEKAPAEREKRRDSEPAEEEELPVVPRDEDEEDEDGDFPIIPILPND